MGRVCPPIEVPVCWAVCKLIVRDSHCPEENIVLIIGRRNEAAREVPTVTRGWGKAGKDTVSTWGSDPTLSLQPSRTLMEGVLEGKEE